MQDILSQEEIDLLIKAASSPVDLAANSQTIEETKDDSTYDFSRPNKFAKEHLRGLQRIHEQFCRTYSGLMSAKLRSRLELKVQSIEQLTFGDYVRSLPNPSVLSFFNIPQLEGDMVIQFSPEIAFLLHDRLCGGPGQLLGKTRGLTDIETTIFRNQVLNTVTRLYSDAWQEVHDLTFNVSGIESNPQFLQIAADRDVVSLVTLSFEFNELHDMLTICIPYRTVETIMNDLTQARMFESLKRPDPARIEQLKAQVRAAIVPVEVELGSATVSVQDLLELDVGDVITLNRKKTETLDIKVGSLTKFKGTPGRLGAKLGVVITGALEPEGVLD